MTATIKNSTATRTPLLIGAGLAALWLALGLVSNGTTYHLAPLLVAAIPATLAALDGPGLVPGRLIGLVGLGAVGALAATALLSATGNLDGPSLLPFGGAAVESVVFAGLGALTALVVGFVRSGGDSGH
jgi:hypothetical protein